MEKYIVKGGKTLSGEVNIQGSKNSAVAILIAALVTDGISVIHNLPDITDVSDCIKILEILGCTVKTEDRHTAVIDTRNAKYTEIPEELICCMRASSYLIGSMLSRFGKCPSVKSGGCNFGRRPLDYHLYAMQTLGAVTTEVNGKEILSAKSGLTGGKIFFKEKTVGGTINALIAASCAKGTTEINNAAKEPHVTDTANYLRSCGCEIEGDGTDFITVKGKTQLHGGEVTVSPDMIEAGTFLILGALPGNSVCCKNIDNAYNSSLFSLFDRAGIKYTLEKNECTVYGDKISAAEILTEPYPGFPTDLQPLAAFLLGKADGKSKITENVFSSGRFRYAEMLGKMGLKYTVNGNEMQIEGNTVYRGATVRSTDLRGGAALVCAATSAKGVSIIENIKYIERGYSSFPEKLRDLGADIVSI